MSNLVLDTALLERILAQHYNDHTIKVHTILVSNIV